MSSCRYRYCLAAMLLVASGHSYAADDNQLPFPDSQMRWMIDHGVGVELQDDFDLFANTMGGKKRGTSPLNTVALSAQADGNKLLGLPGLTGTLSIIDSSLGRPGHTLVGSMQRIDNMEPSQHGFDIYLAWLQKTWMDGKISALAGVYDLSDEFYNTYSSDFFINSTFALDPAISNIGKHNQAAVFPTSAPSVRLKITPFPEWYAQAVLSDGVNSDPTNHSNSLPKLDSNSPAIVMAEAGYDNEKHKESEGLDKLAIGAWRYTSQIQNFLNNGITVTPLNSGTAQGIYMVSEYTIYSFDANRPLIAFAQLDLADPAVNEFSDAWNIGVLWDRVIPWREKSQLGLALSVVDNSRQYEKNLALLGRQADAEEMVVELSYEDELCSWLTAQPDMQYVHNPGAQGLHNDALVIGARLEAKF